MKSDFEKFIELYKSIGIDVFVRDLNGVNNVYKEIFLGNPFEMYSDNDQIKKRLKKFKSSDKFGGHCCFFSTIQFDEDGKFITQGFWE